MPLMIQGREITAEDVEMIRALRQDNPRWSRYRLSREVAERWGWRNLRGKIKDMACRSLLGKLAERKLIDLPAPRWESPNRFRHKVAPLVAHDTGVIEGSLSSLRPLRLLNVGEEETARLFACLLDRYHYLGYRQTVGENMAYLVADCGGRPLSCLLFGSAAWTCAVRDGFIGWSAKLRAARLHLLTNQHRFLVLPWVRIPNLASHVLAVVMQRLSGDWRSKYGHDILLVETFVDRSCFKGMCYRASGWVCVGQTRGRSRNDTEHRLSVPVKDVYVCELKRGARKELCHVP